jgi:arsenate reductase
MTAHWGVEDPAAVQGTDDEKRLAFRSAFATLAARVNLLVNLPIEKLERVSLQKHLQEIGKTGQETKA